MQVKYGLATVLITIHDGAIPAFGNALVTRDRRGGQIHPADNCCVLRIEIVDGRNANSRDYKYVRRRLRIDVSKGDDLIVFVNDIGRNLTGDDL